MATRTPNNPAAAVPEKTAATEPGTVSLCHDSGIKRLSENVADFRELKLPIRNRLARKKEGA